MQCYYLIVFALGSVEQDSDVGDEKVLLGVFGGEGGIAGCPVRG